MNNNIKQIGLAASLDGLNVSEVFLRSTPLGKVVVVARDVKTQQALVVSGPHRDYIKAYKLAKMYCKANRV